MKLGEAIQPAPVKLITAIMHQRDDVLLKTCLDALISYYGPIDHTSDVYVFDHSDYYREEMGDGLQKQFVSFTLLTPPEELIEAKHKCMALEKQTSDGLNRRANLDPSYLELAKLVVATTKNFDHRIYLGRGIYGDIQLRFRQGRLTFNDWTYWDYKSQPVLNFLKAVRETYFKQLKQQV